MGSHGRKLYLHPSHLNQRPQFHHRYVSNDEMVNFTKSDLLPAAYKRWQAGDAIALLWALELCYLNKIPIPDCFGKLINNAGNRIAGYEARTLDEAFELKAPIHRGVNLTAARQRQRLRSLAYVTVGRLRANRKTYEEALSLAAEALGLDERSESYIRDLVRSAKDDFEAPAPDSKEKSD